MKGSRDITNNWHNEYRDRGISQITNETKGNNKGKTSKASSCSHCDPNVYIYEEGIVKK